MLFQIGNFGIVWSGRLTQGPVKETEVAIKKIKGQCQCFLDDTTSVFIILYLNALPQIIC